MAHPLQKSLRYFEKLLKNLVLITKSMCVFEFFFFGWTFADMLKKITQHFNNLNTHTIKLVVINKTNRTKKDRTKTFSVSQNMSKSVKVHRKCSFTL